MSKDELETFCEMKARVFLDEFGDYTSCLLSMEYLPSRSDIHPLFQEMIDCALEAAEAGDEEAFYACYNFGHPRAGPTRASALIREEDHCAKSVQCSTLEGVPVRC